MEVKILNKRQRPFFKISNIFLGKEKISNEKKFKTPRYEQVYRASRDVTGYPNPKPLSTQNTIRREFLIPKPSFSLTIAIPSDHIIRKKFYKK